MEDGFSHGNHSYGSDADATAFAEVVFGGTALFFDLDRPDRPGR